MTNLLVKLFVKNYENKNNLYVRANYGVLVSVVGIICNLLLCITKIIIGLMLSSVSVITDGFNNLSDAASSIISLIASKVSIRPADKEHPFGHGRAEYIAAFVVSFLILQVGFTCFTNSIKKVWNPEPVGFSVVTIIILFISVVLKLWLGYFNKKIGNDINSSVMKATSADAYGDVMITVSTIISILIIKVWGSNVDGLMGVIISCFVIVSGIKIAKETMEPLLGEAIDQKLYSNILNKVKSYEGVIGSHDLIIHNYGPSKSMATLHVEFPNTITIEYAHTIVDGIERDVQKEMGVHLVIHVDPVDIHDEDYLSLRELVICVVKEFEEKASIHDFRIIREDDCIKMVFDMILPFHYKKKDNDYILNRISQKLSTIDKKYVCIITTEHGFVSQ